MLREHINLYVGFDEREEFGSHTFVSSVLHHCSLPVKICHIGEALFGRVPGFEQRDGTNAFTYARFLIPFLEGYRGWAMFCDGADMIVRADLAELWEMRNPYMDVHVVKHTYDTKHPRKYVGTAMESENRNYACKNWSSVMLINCANSAWNRVRPDTMHQFTGADLHQFKFIEPSRIGELPRAWNWLAEEFGENKDAKLLHWTAGIPAFPRYAQSPMADDWASAALKVTHVTK